MIYKLKLHLNYQHMLFLNSRKGFATTVAAMSLMSGKIDELVDESNAMERRLNELEVANKQEEKL